MYFYLWENHLRLIVVKCLLLVLQRIDDGRHRFDFLSRLLIHGDLLARFFLNSSRKYLKLKIMHIQIKPNKNVYLTDDVSGLSNMCNL